MLISISNLLKISAKFAISLNSKIKTMAMTNIEKSNKVKEKAKYYKVKDDEIEKIKIDKVKLSKLKKPARPKSEKLKI